MTGILLAFAGTLLIAVLISSRAHRTVLSTAVLFLTAGFVLGDGMLGVIPLQADDPIVKHLAELALFTVLFTDGMRVGWRELRSAWRLPGRALGWGMPITLVVTALLAKFVAGLDWPEAFLIGAVLAPTDPVFAAALVGNDRVPPRLRRLLNVESGVNDGLALPFVLVLLAITADANDLKLDELAIELGLGLLIGVTVPLLALALERLPIFSASMKYEPLNAVAIGLLVLAGSMALHANLYIAAFAAGVTVSTFGDQHRKAFEEFGELVTELFKLAALLVFGALLTPTFLAQVPWTGWLFAVLALFLARPAAIYVSFLGSKLGGREQAAAMWFGPKGFASVVYGLVVLESDIPAGNEIFHLVAVTIGLSIVLHSSTDVVVAKQFDDESDAPQWYQDDQQQPDRP